MDTHKESLGHTRTRSRSVAVAYLGAFGCSSVANPINSIALPRLAPPRAQSPMLARAVAAAAGMGPWLSGTLIGDVSALTTREALPAAAVIAATGPPSHTMTGVTIGVSTSAMLIGLAAAAVTLSTLSSTTPLLIAPAALAEATIDAALVPHHLGATRLAAELVNAAQWRHINLGWKTIVQNPFVRTLSIMTTTSKMAISALQPPILPVHFSASGQEEMTGFVLAAFVAGTPIECPFYLLAGRFGRRERCVRAGLIGVLTIERPPGEMRGRVFAVQNARRAAALPSGISTSVLLVEGKNGELVGLTIVDIWIVTAMFASFSLSVTTLSTELSLSTQPPSTSRACFS